LNRSWLQAKLPESANRTAKGSRKNRAEKVEPRANQSANQSAVQDAANNAASPAPNGRRAETGASTTQHATPAPAANGKSANGQVERRRSNGASPGSGMLTAPQQSAFSLSELPIVLSHYDLGIVESVAPFRRGSRRSPKVGIISEQGKFLLKRRAPFRADAERVHFAHAVQKALVAAQFPAPRLVRLKGSSQTLLELSGSIYELFEFIPGEAYRRTPGQAYAAGVALAEFHRATEQFAPSPGMPRGAYHDMPGVRTGLCALESVLGDGDPPADPGEVAELTQALLHTYDAAADTVNAAGFAHWRERIVHADWHPGNLLFRGNEVIAVIDYDSVRLARRITDVANGALQFSLTGSGDPETWPPELDEGRFTSFVVGYSGAEPLDADERRCLPALMIEALLAECVPPIHETGSVGQWGGINVLRMVRRKTRWLSEHADHLLHLLQA
jgi:Ser/Thr protein kinase RdoA (MazF antagonist)